MGGEGWEGVQTRDGGVNRGRYLLLSGVYGVTHTRRNGQNEWPGSQNRGDHSD